MLEKQQNAYEYLELAGVIFVALDCDGKITMINQKGCESLGYTQDEILGRSWFDFVPLREKEFIELNFLRLMRKEVDHIDYYERSILTKNNEERLIAWYISILEDSQGNITGLVSSGQDITEKAAAEMEREQEKLAFQIIAETSVEAMDSRHLANGMISRLAKVLGYDYGIVRLYDQTMNEYTMLAAYGWESGELEIIMTTAERLALLPSSRIIQTRSPLIIPDTRKVDIPQDTSAIISSSGIISLVGWPLLGFDNNPIGVIILLSKEPLEPTQLNLSFFERVAGGFSLALQRSLTMQALSESEEKYRTLVENMPVVSWVTRKDGKTEYISSNVVDVYGYTPEEIFEKGEDLWIGRIHTEDVSRVLESFTALFETGAEYDVEYRIQREDGQWIWLRDKANTVYERNGITYASGAFMDITEQRNVADALRESEERHRRLFENAQVGIAHTRISDGKLIRCNEMTARLFGYSSPAEAINDYITSEHYVDLNDRLELFEALSESGEVSNYELQITKKDGSPIWLESFGRLYPDEGYLESVFVDITERKEAEEKRTAVEFALRESERKYRSLYESSRDGIAATNLRGQFTDFNPAFLEMLDYSEDELSNLTSRDITPEMWHLRMESIMSNQVNVRGYSDMFQTELFTRNGTIIPVELRVYQTYDDDGKHNGYWAILRDISERKRAELELQRERDTAQQYLDTSMLYLDLMGHDLRNRLQAIQMGVEILQFREINLEIKPITDEILDAVRAAKALIEKAHATEGLLTVPLKKRSLRLALDHNISELKRMFGEIQIELEIMGSEVIITADDYLDHLIMTILENCVLHNDKEDITLWISLHMVENCYVLAVSDNGPGIANDLKETLFDQKRRFGGLGLHQAKRIVKKYGGRLEVSDRQFDNPAEGVTFTIWFPKGDA